jgi:hypothetical protein
MKYMALIYSADGSGPDYDTPEFGAMMGAYKKATETFQKDGVMVGGDPLENASTATSIRVRNGKTETMDGPFAETKEQLGGYYIFDCKNLDDAIRYAAMIPTAEYGTVEVRPLLSMDGS